MNFNSLVSTELDSIIADLKQCQSLELEQGHIDADKDLLTALLSLSRGYPTEIQSKVEEIIKLFVDMEKWYA